MNNWIRCAGSHGPHGLVRVSGVQVTALSAHDWQSQCIRCSVVLLVGVLDRHWRKVSANRSIQVSSPRPLTRCCREFGRVFQHEVYVSVQLLSRVIWVSFVNQLLRAKVDTPKTPLYLKTTRTFIAENRQWYPEQHPHRHTTHTITRTIFPFVHH